ncbi:Cytosolic sulfotransferase 13 [Morella rubra]|uniref:Sulfotransferase n=1 Tax=Morella rubra TaxID=262757 RepID=A0A6A1VRY8_9ROSI|nr:Cytosolic sulfotransferase 13 [Morella rubra]
MATHQPVPPPPTSESLEEDELNQEVRDVISSLPTVEGWLSHYQGFWIPTKCMHGVLATQKHLQAHETDILLATIPKAGTTWLKAILFALVNRVRYLDSQQHPLLANNPHTLLPFLETKLFYKKNEVSDLTLLTSPRLFATHLSYSSLPTSVKNSTCKIVYVCRNPKDTFVSQWHFQNKVGALMVTKPVSNSLEQSFNNFCRGMSVYGPFWDHVLSYWIESLEKPEKVFFLKYEEMKEQPIIHLKRLAEFLGCSFSPEEEEKGRVNDILKLCSFDNLSNLEINKKGKSSVFGIENASYFRKGEVGDWKNYLTAQMVERLDCITEEKFHTVGLKF